MILGCSNTYQQLATAPLVEEIPWILSKKGDCKVGTNSPWNINVKKSGKAKAWGSWLLLICTSIVCSNRILDEVVVLLIISKPVHFLANSVIGPSFYIEMPTNVTYFYNETLNLDTTNQSYYSSNLYVSYITTYDSACVSHISSPFGRLSTI